MRITLATVIMGVSGLVAQVLLIRELLIVFSGNEFSLGIILGNWLVFEALGSFVLGRRAADLKDAPKVFFIVTFLFCIFLLAGILATRSVKNVLGISISENVPLLPIFYSSLIVLSPVSFFHGALFPITCQLYSATAEDPSSSPGRVYGLETIGTVLGGLISSLFLIQHLNSFETTCILALVNLAVGASIWIFGTMKTPKKGDWITAGSAFAMFLGLTSVIENIDEFSISVQWKGHNVIHYQNSYYGNICVIENEGQYIFLQDGVPGLIIPFPDMPSIEEFVHIPLLAHPHPRNLFIVSGGAGGVINEVLKHPTVENIEYAELDPLLLELLKKFPTSLTESELNDPRVRVEHQDGRLLLRKTENLYDLIMIGIGEPSTLQSNRLFTQEFFTIAKGKLRRDGILVLTLPGSLTHRDQGLRDLNSSIFHTLKRVFYRVRVLPGSGSNLFLASDSTDILSFNKERLLERLRERSIGTETAIPWYIEQKLHEGWEKWFSRFIREGSAKINSDLAPVGVFYWSWHWNAVFAPTLSSIFSVLRGMDAFGIIGGLGLLVMFVIVFRGKIASSATRASALTITTTGICGMMLELLVLFLFQCFYGYVFWWIGILMSTFMAGAALGAIGMVKLHRSPERSLGLLLKFEVGMVIFFLALALILSIQGLSLELSRVGELAKGIVLLISFLGGAAVGAEFPLANALWGEHGKDPMEAGGFLYACDLLGGWAGGAIGGAFLLPILGAPGTCLAMGLSKIMSVVVLATVSSSGIVGSGGGGTRA